jgi:hypothetical protein
VQVVDAADADDERDLGLGLDVEAAGLLGLAAEADEVGLLLFRLRKRRGGTGGLVFFLSGKRRAETEKRKGGREGEKAREPPKNGKSGDRPPRASSAFLFLSSLVLRRASLSGPVSIRLFSWMGRSLIESKARGVRRPSRGGATVGSEREQESGKAAISLSTAAAATQAPSLRRRHSGATSLRPSSLSVFEI